MTAAVPVSSSQECVLKRAIIAALDRLPANIPIDFFGLIHHLGFVSEDRALLEAAVTRLISEGRILSPAVAKPLEFATPLMSHRMQVGITEPATAVTIFGEPAARSTWSSETVLSYSPSTSRCRQIQSEEDDFIHESGNGFSLHFDQAGRFLYARNGVTEPNRRSV